MPPSSAVISTYLPWPTAHFVRSRQVSEFVNAEASGPVISTIRSTDDVPHGHVVEQRPVLLDRVGVVARQVHVVVDVVGGAAGLERLLEERRAAVPRPEIERGRVVGGGRSRRTGHGIGTSWGGREMVGHGISIASRVPPDGPAVARGGHGRTAYAASTPGASPSSPSAAPVAQATHVRARDRRPVGDDLERQPVEQRQDPPRRAGRVGADERPAGHALADRPLEQPLPLEVEPARRRLEGGPASGLGPGVEPQLERPVLVGRRVRPEERRAAPRPGRSASAISRADSARSCCATCSNAAASTSSIESK